MPAVLREMYCYQLKLTQWVQGGGSGGGGKEGREGKGRMKGGRKEGEFVL